MVYTCTLNPAIDLFVDINTLKPYVVNRSNFEDYQANGKGINISIILKRMGIHNTALGFIGGFTGNFIKSELTKHGVDTDFIEIDGITRINTFIRLKEKEYKIVNKGPFVPEAKIGNMILKIKNIPNNSILFVNGSLPEGVSDDIYVEIAKISRQKNLKLILDISSKRLLDCLAYKPYLIKPNDEELANFFNKSYLDNDEEIIDLSRMLLKKGAQRVLVSLGERGSIFLSDKKILKVSSAKGKVVNTTCAGDALLGSFVGKLILGSSVEEALKYGSATGASTAFTSGLSDLTDIENLIQDIRLSQIN